MQGKKSKKVKPKYICKGGKKVCGLAITDEDCVRCDLCEEWYHPKCQGLTIDAFRALSTYELLWLCSSCRPNFMSALKMGKQIEDKLDIMEKKILGTIETSGMKYKPSQQLEEKIISMRETVVGKMTEQQAEVDKTLKANQEIVQSLPKLQSELKKSAQELKKMVERKQDKEGREANIVIHNIPESKSDDPEALKKYDSDSFQNLVKALMGESKSMETNRIFRLGKKRGQGG